VNLGRLSQLLRVDLPAWRAPLAFASMLAVMQLISRMLPGAMRYDRVAILDDGQYARLLTGHLVHHDLTHLGWNLAGLALVGWLFAREFTLRGWLVIFVASTVAVDLGFLVFEPQLAWYVGFSGVLHGLMAAGLCAWLWRTPDAITALVAVLFACKLGWEHFFGPLPFTASSLDVPVIHQAHTYGAIGGTVAALMLLARGRRTATPL
jgi:rhomboid family GlyGly-CTERM serine protease